MTLYASILSEKIESTKRFEKLLEASKISADDIPEEVKGHHNESIEKLEGVILKRIK